MSLVNDMLRDLDRRRRLPAGISSSSYARDDGSERSAGSAWKVALLTLVGVIIGVGAGYLYFQRQAMENSVGIMSTPQPVNDTRTAAPSGNQATGGQTLVTQPVERSPAVARRRIAVTESVGDGDGFRIRIASQQAFSHQVVTMTDYSIDVLLEDIDAVASNAVTRGGFNLITSEQGVNAVIELNRRVSFRLTEEKDMSDGGMTLVIAVSPVAPVAPDPESVTNADKPAGADSGSSVAGTRDAGKDMQAPAADGGRQSAQAPSAPVRTNREPTQEELDINNSRSASQLIQRGELMAAYQKLLGYIGDNPDARHSREALAKLLFAQQEYLQANAVVDQGLALAPSYPPYKKIKARLLLMDGGTQEAVRLLNNLSPELAEDPEYFELLASAFQQDKQYLKAIETYQDLLRYNSKVGRWWAGMGISHEALGNIDDAIASYQAAVQSPGLEPALRQYSQNRIRNLKN